MELTGRKVVVHDGNVEKALRKFKKKIGKGFLQELRNREQYVKPTTKRKLKKSAAKNRWRKYLREQSLPKQLY